MNNLLEKSDFEDFHFLKIDPNTLEAGPLMPFYVESGWYPLLYSLCLIINGYLRRSGDISLLKNFYVLNVTQKNGGLRFYVSTYDENNYLYDLIQRYEEKSYSICEKCGRDGKLTKFKHSNFKTVCQDCLPNFLTNESFIDRVKIFLHFMIQRNRR